MSEYTTIKEPVLILGGGIAGLATAHYLKDAGIDATVFEATDIPGGVTRSFTWHGFTCDVACHRFFTTHPGILEEVQRVTPMFKTLRRSQIMLRGRVLKDPISPPELIFRMPPYLSAQLVSGYFFHKRVPDSNFDNYVHNRYGPGLNDLFFKPYTEKMFGIPAREVSIEWGEQKVRVSGLVDVIKQNTKIYFRHFHYPKSGGFGAISEGLHDRIGDHLVLESRVVGLERDDDRITRVHVESGGCVESHDAGTVISTIPITDLGELLDVDVELRFRPIQVAYLLIGKPRVTENHWVYFGDGDIHINRLGEFKNFLSNGVPADRTVLAAEITMDTGDAVREAITGCERYGLIRADDVLDAMVVREPFAYPIYACNYLDRLHEVQARFERYTNLRLIGRSALFHHAEIDDNFLGARELVRRLLGHES